MRPESSFWVLGGLAEDLRLAVEVGDLRLAARVAQVGGTPPPSVRGRQDLPARLAARVAKVGGKTTVVRGRQDLPSRRCSALRHRVSLDPVPGEALGERHPLCAATALMVALRARRIVRAPPEPRHPLTPFSYGLVEYGISSRSGAKQD